jgi:23S rRNA pseudouridine1911/1915/1917 synthase
VIPPRLSKASISPIFGPDDRAGLPDFSQGFGPFFWFSGFLKVRFMSLDVIYEDNHLIAVFKPARVPVQGDSSGDVSLLEQTKEWLKEKHKKPGNVFLALVHRLDRPVSGVVIFGKTSKGASRISEAIRSRKVQKTYRAVVEGVLKKDADSIEGMWSWDYTINRAEISVGGTKEARLSYVVIKRGAHRTLVEIDLQTGRKHQIRAQMASLGHPIVGDSRYGASSEGRIIALRCEKMVVPHPVTKEPLTVEVSKSTPFLEMDFPL